MLPLQSVVCVHICDVNFGNSFHSTKHKVVGLAHICEDVS